VILLIYYYCNNITCSNMGSTWGLVVRGECVPAIANGSQVSVCVDNEGTTTILEHYYEMQCGYVDGVCQCHAVPNPYISQEVRVCNCGQLTDNF
jgi:hypothetical protein